MDISFKNKKLEQYANFDKKGKKALGETLFKKYKLRLDQLAAAKKLEDLRNAPGKFHELKGDRKGQWACSLVGKYRLIFEPQEDPIPKNEDGQYIWSAIKAVAIEEIVDYH